MPTNMMRRLLIPCLLYLFVACTHTVVGGQEYSPNEMYVLIFEMHGASGKAYTEISDKRVNFTIKEKINNNVLLKSELVITAGDLKADVNWDIERQIDVNFYEERGVFRKDIKSVRIFKKDGGEFAVE